MSLTPEIVADLKEKLGKKHVMFSYNWGVQNLVRTVYEYIESRDIPVWMDIKGGIHGNINAAMAEAVENAMVICPFMTEAYQKSESCELELNYAKDCQVQIVPCMVQKQATDGGRYKASGWLGVITAGKLWTDFRDAEDDPAKIAQQSDALLLEIASKLNVDTRGGFKPVKPPPQQAPIEPAPSKPAPPKSEQAAAPIPTGDSGTSSGILAVLVGNWSQYSGLLTCVSKGKSGVWGVNRNDDIYQQNGESWQSVPGKLVQISSGSEVWGVNRSDEIYRYKGNNAWQRISGALKNVDVSDQGRVWGVNNNQDIYRRTGDSWQHIDGKAIQVSVGKSGVWVVNTNHDIYYRAGTSGDKDTAGTNWVNISGKLKWISSGRNIVVGCNSNNDIFYRTGVSQDNPTGDSWVHVSGKLVQIDVHEDLTVGVNSSDHIYKSSVRHSDKNRDSPTVLVGNWSQYSGLLTCVSKGKSGVWGVNRNEDIYQQNGQSWQSVPGKLVQISSGSEVWGVNRSDEIYRYKGNNAWQRISGALKNVDVSDQGRVWGVNNNQDIYRRTGDSWQHIDGKAIQISVGKSGVWVVNTNHDIYYRAGTFGDKDTAGTNWVNISGKLKWISSGRNIVVGCNSNNDIFYRTGVSEDNPTGDSWVHVSGKLVQIDVHEDLTVGVNSSDHIYKSDVL